MRTQNPIFPRAHHPLRGYPARPRKALTVLTVSLIAMVTASHAWASRLLVSSALSNTVMRFNGQTGSFTDQFGASASVPVSYPDGMAVGPDGGIYVRSAGNVVRFDGTTGTPSLFSPSSGQDPSNLAFEVRVDPSSGSFVATPATGGLDGPTGLTFGPDGNVYVSSYGSVLRYRGQNGASMGTFASGGGLVNATGLAFGPDHNLYVSNYPGNTILCYSGTTGAFLKTFVTAGSGGLNRPIGLTFGPDGNLYVCSYNTNQVLSYNGSTGAPIGSFASGGGLSGPTGLCFGPDGNLYVASYLSSTVPYFNGTTGAFISYFVPSGGSGLNGPFSVCFTLEAPTNLTATVQSSSQVALSWTNNSPDATNIEVDRQASGGAVVTFPLQGANVTNYTDNSAVQNTTYTYFVRAVSKASASGYVTATVTTPADIPIPPANLVAQATGPAQVSLSWIDNAANETGEELWRQQAGGSFQLLFTLAAHATSYTDTTGLSAGVTYNYEVRAVNGPTAASTFSNQATVTMPSPPAAPTGLTQGTVTPTQISLTWTDNSTNENAFEVWRKTGSGGYGTTPLAVLAAGSTSFTDSGLAIGTTYTYEVRATNGSGASAYTNPLTVTTPAVTPPSAPTGLTIGSVTPTQVPMSWTDNSTNETGFEVWRKTGSGTYGTTPLAVLPAGSTKYTDTSVAIGTSYTYEVRAINAYYQSAFTLPATASTPNVTPPNAPTSLTVGSVTPTQVGLSWTDNSTNETGFEVWRNNGSGYGSTPLAVLAAGSTSFTDANVALGTSYSYKVRAVNTYYQSAFTNEVNASTPNVTAPNAPTGLTIGAVTPTQVSLSWTDNSTNETGFEVWRNNGSGYGSTPLTVLAAGSNSYTDTSVAIGTAYTYKVRAINTFYQSAFTNEATTSTPNVTPPNAPTSLTVGSVTPTQVGLSWTDNSTNETGFEVWRNNGSGYGSTPLAVLAAGSTSFTDANVALGTSYSYKVRAVNTYYQSAFTNEVNASTPNATPPAAPSNLTATANPDSSVSLSWQSNSTNATAFSIWRETSTTAYVRIGVISPTQTTFADTTATAGTTYTYKVRAANNFYASAFSNEASATAFLVTPPAAPSNLTASPDPSGAVDLSWQSNSTNATAFSIWRETSTTAYVRIGVISPTQTTFADTTATAGTTYTYKVRAANNYYVSAFSNEASATAPTLVVTPPAAPSNLTATASPNNTVSLSWQSNSTNATAFSIWRETSTTAYVRIGVIAPSQTTFTDTTTTAGTTYTYKVRAANNFYASAFSNEASATAFLVTPPAAPSNLTATPGSAGMVTLNWQSNSTNATAFSIWRETGTSGYIRIGVVSPTQTTFTDTSTTVGVTYTYKVRAANNYFVSAFSSEVPVTTTP